MSAGLDLAATVSSRKVQRALLCALCFVGAKSQAQELEPRAYSPNPIGANFLLIGAAQSEGDVFTDASLPLSGVEARLNSAVLGYNRTFGWLTRSASVGLAVPYVAGEVSGDIGENRREVHRSALADVKLRLAMHLVGGEALTPTQFKMRTPQTALGASVVIVAPTGQYDGSKLVNIGSNRWAFRPEIGLSHPVGHWHLEAYTGVWLFTANDDFFGGNRREQDPIGYLQSHVSYTFRPRMWIATDATYYRGGQTTVNGQGNADLQSNVRIGLTFSLPLGTRQSIKISWSEGVATRIGGDYRTYGVAWQYAWFDR